jgi:hypothetical protein
MRPSGLRRGHNPAPPAERAAPLGSAAASVESVRLDPELKRALLIRVAEDDVCVSEVIRRAISEYLLASRLGLRCGRTSQSTTTAPGLSRTGRSLGAAQRQSLIPADGLHVDPAGVKPRNRPAWPASTGAVCRVTESRYVTQPPVNR